MRVPLTPCRTRQAVADIVTAEAVAAAQGQGSAGGPLNLVRDDAPGSAIERAKGFARHAGGRVARRRRVLREALTGRMKTLGRKGKCTPTRNLPTTGAMGLPVPQPHAPCRLRGAKFHLQIELLRSCKPGLRKPASVWSFCLKARCGGQGRHDQTLYGTPQPARCAIGGAGKAQRHRARQWYFSALRQHCPRVARSCCLTAGWYNPAGSNA